MTLRALSSDALRRKLEVSELRIALPWIRSMPLACVRDLTIEVDGSPVEAVVLLGDRRVSAASLPNETAWWMPQDRLVVELPAVSSGPHQVAVSFVLQVPYLALGPDGPLSLPIRDARELDHTSITTHAASRDVA